MEKNKIAFSMGLISLLAFVASAIDSFTAWNLTAWQSALLYVIFGSGLFLFAGGFAIYHIIDDGKIDTIETMRILTALVGLFSVIVGLPLIPIPFFQGLESNALQGVRGLISIFAAIFIAIQLFWAKVVEK